MNAFAHHFSFEFRVGIRNKTLMLMNYLFPLGCYVMFGALLGSINPGLPPGDRPGHVDLRRGWAERCWGCPKCW